MKTLIIKYLPTGEKSQTKKLLDLFLQETKNQNIEVVDLLKEEIPIFDESNIQAYYKRNYGGQKLNESEAKLLEKITINNKTTGATDIMPSSLSSTPPCPGIILPESLTPKILLNLDSNKSLNCSIIDKNADNKIKNKVPPANINELRKPIIILAKIPPIKPDQVLCGLMVGAIFAPPNVLPAKNAKISVDQITANIQNKISTL